MSKRPKIKSYRAERAQRDAAYGHEDANDRHGTQGVESGHQDRLGHLLYRDCGAGTYTILKGEGK